MEYEKILFTSLVAVVGWVVAHRLTSARDLANSRRSARIDALTTCYKALVRSGIDGVMFKRDSSGKLINGAMPVEDAIALIHLHGNEQQSELASAYARQVGETKTGDSTKLVNALRKDIRRMLGTKDLGSDPHYLSIKTNEPPA